jgi:competence protein ComEC
VGVAFDSVDLRLVPAAAAAWAGAVVSVVSPQRTTLVAVSAVAALVTIPAIDRVMRRHRRAFRALPATTLALLVLVGSLAVGAVLRHERESGSLAQATAGGWTATLRGTVADDPLPLAVSWGGTDPRIRYTLAVTAIEARGTATGAHGDVVVLASGEAPILGSTVAVTGRLQPPASRTDRAVATLAVNGSATTIRGPSGVQRWVGTVRAAARDVVAQVPGDAGGLLLGVALGDTSRVDDELSNAFKIAGLTHLVAVSGSHFAIIGALVAAAAAACRLPRLARAAAVLGADVVLVLLVGPQPSVLRAAVMGTVSLVGLLAGRPSRAPAALAASVVALLLTDPWLSVEIGFTLSVAATAAIVLLAGPWTERWAPRLGRGPAAGIAVPLAAQLACGPVLLAIRPQVGAYSLVANVLVAPAVGPATIFGVATALLAPLWPAGALVLAHLGGAACWWIAAVGRAMATAPGAAVGWAPGVVGIAALAAASVAAAALLFRAGRVPGR